MNPPPLFKAIASTKPRERVELGIFITRAQAQAQQALADQLDEWHESIAFEADHHHLSLDARFEQFSRIEEV